MCKSNNRRAWLSWPTTLFISIASVALAHDPGLSTAALKVSSERIDAEIIFARADIEALVPLDANHDGKVSPEEWDRARPELEALVREPLKVLVNDAAVAITEPSFHLDENNNFRIAGIFPAQGAKALTVESPLIKRLPRGHRQFVSVVGWQKRCVRRGAAERGARRNRRRRAQGVLGGAPNRKNRHFSRVFYNGRGPHPDRLRSPALSLRPAHRDVAVSCDGVGHHLLHAGALTTLALAAFDFVRVPGTVVEPLIAATIIYVGAENLLRLDSPTGRWRLTLIFGLVHGLGFATDLKEKLAGMIGAKIAVPLVSFNLGVELGQMAAAALLLPLIWWLRTETVFVRRSLPVCSALVVLAGTWWLLQRTLLV